MSLVGHKPKYTWLLSLGQAVAFVGVLFHWNALADPYCVSKYALIASLCLAYSCTSTPKRGYLTVSAVVYLTALVVISTLAFKSVCFVGKKLNYFTGVFPMFLVAICYHYSIGDKWERISNSYIVACVIASIVAIAQAFGWFMPQGDYFNGRVYALVGSPVFLSGVLAMAIPLCMGRRHSIVTIPVIITAMLFTQSRSGLVAVAAGVLGYAYASGLIGSRGFGGLAAASVLVASFMFSGMRDTSKSDGGRYQMSRVAVKTIVEHPLGIGPERFGWAIQKYRDAEFDRALSDRWMNSYAHNHLIEAMVAGGPAFLAVHIGILCAVGLFLFRFGTPHVFGAAAALCAFGLMQPTPLLMKCVLACLAACFDPHPGDIRRSPFILMAVLAFMASVSAITCAKIYMDGVTAGLADIVVGSFDHQKSAQGEQ